MERRAGFHSSFPLLLLLLLALALCSCLFKSPVGKAHILLSVGILCIITITKASAPDSGWAGTAGPAWPGGCWRERQGDPTGTTGQPQLRSIVGIPVPGLQGRASVQRPNPQQVRRKVSLNLTRQNRICVTYSPHLIAPARRISAEPGASTGLGDAHRHSVPGQDGSAAPNPPLAPSIPSGEEGPGT